MTTSTERLRKLLDERGVEWHEPPTRPNKTWFPDENGINCSASPWSDTLEIKRHGLTPEQAIAATLGSGTCEFKPFQGEDASEPNAMRGVCSECSALMYGKDNFCPNCGREVVSE